MTNSKDETDRANAVVDFFTAANEFRAPHRTPPRRTPHPIGRARLLRREPIR